MSQTLCLFQHNNRAALGFRSGCFPRFHCRSPHQPGASRLGQLWRRPESGILRTRFQSQEQGVEVSPAISSWYRSTSRTSSGSFPARSDQTPIPYRWWAHWEAVPCRLSWTGPHGPRPRHQVLSSCPARSDSRRLPRSSCSRPGSPAPW